MATRAAANSEGRTDDDETTAVIYQGATIRQLSIMFKADPKVVTRKVSSLVPVGTRRGTSIYSVAEAAGRLVSPGYDIERHIIAMNHSDLPPLLSKEFWNGQNARLKYEESNGDLWRTADVVRLISVLFNTVRMILLLLPDTVEREGGITREQKAVVRRVIDGAIVEGRKEIIKQFKGYSSEPEYDGAANGSGPLSVDEHVETFDRGTGISAAPARQDEYCGL